MLQSRENEIIALHEARAAAREAQRFIGEALGAQAYAKADDSPAAHDIADVYASRAYRALTEMYVALEPLPEDVWQRGESA